MLDLLVYWGGRGGRTEGVVKVYEGLLVRVAVQPVLVLKLRPGRTWTMACDRIQCILY